MTKPTIIKLTDVKPSDVVIATNDDQGLAMIRPRIQGVRDLLFSLPLTKDRFFYLMQGEQAEMQKLLELLAEAYESGETQAIGFDFDAKVREVLEDTGWKGGN